MKSFILPDYNNSNINISATLAEFLGAPNNNATLPLLKKELEKNYKNIVFICFDGMGIYPINKNLKKNDFLVKNIKSTLKSTFPSTTTNATTSLLLNKVPLEHGWFGWSLYFENINRNINIFSSKDSWTNEEVNVDYSIIADLDYYFYNANTKYEINTLFPSYVKVKKPHTNNIYESNEDFFELLNKLCNKKGKQFIYAYNPEPDSTMHLYGVSSKEAKGVFENLSKNIKKLCEKTKDTLFIITADHGQIDVEGYVNLYEDEKLMDMLEIYPFLEPRAIAFKVKKEKFLEFEHYFKSKYYEDFELHTSQELVEAGYFGNTGDKQHLLGDYIAIGTYTHKQALLTPTSKAFKGQHTSLTEEMDVPLILINN